MIEINSKSLTSEIPVTTSGVTLNELDQAGDFYEALSGVINSIGSTFGCDRVYIMEKNEAGSYDCTHEWTAPDVLHKQHLLQNLEPGSVRFYYQYFLSGRHLLFKDIHDLQATDPALYKILKPQDLRSGLCSQLLIDEQDAGFIGFDNPSPDKFDELVRIIDVLRFFVASRVQRKNLGANLRSQNMFPLVENFYTQEHSLSHRISQIVPDKYLAMIYFDGSLKLEDVRPSSEVLQQMISCCESVLGRIFGQDNVFHVTKTEFLIFFDNSSEWGVDSLSYYVSMAKKTFESMNIVATMGYASTRHYHADFFELVQIANVRMLRNKQDYRRQFMGKYHLPTSPVFHDLVEVKPHSGTYQVLYSEYMENPNATGDIKHALAELKSLIIPTERDKFASFIHMILTPVSLADRDMEQLLVFTDTFTIQRNGKSCVLGLHMISYFNVDGDLVYMAYTV